MLYFREYINKTSWKGGMIAVPPKWAHDRRKVRKGDRRKITVTLHCSCYAQIFTEIFLIHPAEFQQTMLTTHTSLPIPLFQWADMEPTAWTLFPSFSIHKNIVDIINPSVNPYYSRGYSWSNLAICRWYFAVFRQCNIPSAHSSWRFSVHSALFQAGK